MTWPSVMLSLLFASLQPDSENVLAKRFADVAGYDSIQSVEYVARPSDLLSPFLLVSYRPLAVIEETAFSSKGPYGDRGGSGEG